MELAVQPKVAVGLHARKGVPEMGRKLPGTERFVGILMSFMACLLNETVWGGREAYEQVIKWSFEY